MLVWHDLVWSVLLWWTDGRTRHLTHVTIKFLPQDTNIQIILSLHNILMICFTRACYHDISIYINMTQHELNKHKNHHLVLPPTESHTSEYSEAHLADSTPYTPAPSFQCWEISKMTWFCCTFVLCFTPFCNKFGSFLIAWEYSVDRLPTPLFLVIETNFSLVSFKYKPQYNYSFKIWIKFWKNKLTFMQGAIL